MSHKQHTQVATVIFALVALMHALRLFNGWDAMIGTFAVPMWWSIIGVAILGYMAWSGYRMLMK